MSGRPNVDNGFGWLAEPATILRGTVGSSAHGLSIAGYDDTDEMGVCIEPPEYVIGLQRFEQWVYRTQPEGAKSGPGDLDLTVFSLRKYARLAADGNPTVLILLFTPAYRAAEPWGERLRAEAEMFASLRAGHRFLGYLKAQRERLLGERGGMRVRRPDLVERYGYDVKYAMHMIRLGLQGVEYLQTGRLTLPMPEPDRSLCRDVRAGVYTREQVLDLAADLERRIEAAIRAGVLPERPDERRIDRFLVEAYRAGWGR